jgi:phospholipase C
VCEDPQTLADELDAAGLTWKFYAVAGPPKQPGTIPSDWNGFGAVSHIYNSSMWTQNVASGPRKILSDLAHGKLANMTWVTPTWTNSDHSAARSKTGPAWIASVVNAIGKSAFWNSTVIFVVWDDWGGWYDHVPPPQLDYDGLGFRVPLLIISPYAAQGVVAHKQLEFGSILRYIENNWGLGQLGTSDARATPVDQGCSATQPCLNYGQSPRPFMKIDAPLPPSFFIDQPYDSTPYDTQ